MYDMSKLMMYPTGAGGNFLLYLMPENKDTIVQAAFNEYVHKPEYSDMKLHEKEHDKPVDINRFNWFKTHDVFYTRYFDQDNITIISSGDLATVQYVNVLGSLKINLNRNQNLDVLYRAGMLHRWIALNEYKYIPYEKIFFDVDLDDTPWAGKEEQVAAYTAANMRLMRDYGYSSFIPKR